MQVGVALPVTVEGLWDAPATLESWARAVDEGPFCSLGFGGRISGDAPDVVALLGAVAAWTRRVPIRATVTVQLYDPLLLAKGLATVDRISDGRLEVAFGITGRDDDYRALGIDLATQNVHQLLERARTMRWVWRGDHLTDTVRPVGPVPTRPGGPPLLLASYGLQSALGAVEWADGLVYVIAGPGDRDLQEMTETFAAVRRAWAEQGRPVPRLTVSFWFALEETAPQGARAQIGAHLRDYLDWMPPEYVEELCASSGFVGTAEELVELLRRIEDLGVDEVHLLPTSVDVAQVGLLADVVGKTLG